MDQQPTALESAICKIMVDNKYKAKLSPGDKTIMCVDILESAKKIAALLEEKQTTTSVPTVKEPVPEIIGTLTQAQGQRGFKLADVGHPVYELGDKYIIYYESDDGKKTIPISYYKHSLESVIKLN